MLPWPGLSQDTTCACAVPAITQHLPVYDMTGKMFVLGNCDYTTTYTQIYEQDAKTQMMSCITRNPEDYLLRL